MYMQQSHCVLMFNYIIVQHFTQIFMEKYIYKQYMLIVERLPKHYYNNIFLFKYKPIALLQTNFLSLSLSPLVADYRISSHQMYSD